MVTWPICRVPCRFDFSGWRGPYVLCRPAIRYQGIKSHAHPATAPTRPCFPDGFRTLWGADPAGSAVPCATVGAGPGLAMERFGLLRRVFLPVVVPSVGVDGVAEPLPAL